MKPSFPRAQYHVALALAVLALSNSVFCGEIHDAAKNGDLEKVTALLKSSPDLVSSKDKDGNTPLHVAALYVHKDIVQVLLTNKADVNAKDNNGDTPLHLAAAGGQMAIDGHKDVAELLLANKADVNAKDVVGLTPLHWAVLTGHKDVLELLLANGAAPNAKDNHGRTPTDCIGAVIDKKDTAALNAEMATLLRQPRPAPPATQPGVATERSAAAWKAGDTVFVRVKHYTTLSGDPTMQDAQGGKGYVLKNLSSSVITPIAEPTPSDTTVAFGDALTLIEKKDGLPTMWLVGKGQTKVQLPAYLLTASKAEIDLLKEKNRIPDSLTFVYNDTDDNLKVWGVCIGGIAGTDIVDSHGLILLAYAKGTSPFALKNDGVIFDESAVKVAWSTPPVFDKDKKPLDLSSSCIYYCVSGGDKPAFESMDLKVPKSDR